MKKLLIALLLLTSCQTTSDVQLNHVKPIIQYENRFDFIFKYRELSRPFTKEEKEEIDASLRLLSPRERDAIIAPLLEPISPRRFLRKRA